MQWQKPMAETCFCRTGLNRFKPRFKPPLAETCQPWENRNSAWPSTQSSLKGNARECFRFWLLCYNVASVCRLSV